MKRRASGAGSPRVTSTKGRATFHAVDRSESFAGFATGADMAPRAALEGVRGLSLRIGEATVRNRAAETVRNMADGEEQGATGAAPGEGQGSAPGPPREVCYGFFVPAGGCAAAGGCGCGFGGAPPAPGTGIADFG